MKRTCLALTLVISFFGLGAVAFAGGNINIQEGLWEINSSVKIEMPDMPDMPNMDMPDTSYTQCITKENFVPQDNQPGQECTISNVQQDGDKVTWTIQCNASGGMMKGTSTITYKGTTFSGDMQMTISGQQGMQINTHMEGRRIGDCP